MGSASQNNAVIKYFKADTNEAVTTSAIAVKPSVGSNIVKINVTILSGDKSQNVSFEVTVPAVGDIKVKLY